MSYDFTIQDHGSICILTPGTPGAEAWVEEYLSGDETQYWGAKGVVIEPCYLPPIIEHIHHDGLTLKIV